MYWPVDICWGLLAGKLHPSRVRHFCTECTDCVLAERLYLQYSTNQKIPPASCQACCMPWMQSEGLERKATSLSWTHYVVPHLCRSKQIEADFRGLGRIVLNLGLSLPVALHCCAHEHTRHIVTYPTLRSTSVGFRLPSQLESA